MYTELLESVQAVGKTVQKITYSPLGSQMLVVFTDETFMAIGIDYGYESRDDLVRMCAFDLDAFERDALIESGIITDEELQQKVEEINREGEETREAAEHRHSGWQHEKFGWM